MHQSAELMEASRIARDLYGLSGELDRLPGESDLNYRVRSGGERYVLKLHTPGTDRDVLRLQDDALRHIGGLPSPPPVPRPVPDKDGRYGPTVAWADGERVARLLTWVDGRPLADAEPTPELLRDLGRHVASVDGALSGFTHPAMRRDLGWDLTTAPRTEALLPLVADDLRPLVAEVLDRCRDHVAPRLAALPHQVIHNDANEHNVMVGDDGAVSGFIDFGDVLWNPRVCGLAVAAAYATQGHADPLRAVLPVVTGYDEVTPLTVGELAVLYDLMRARLAMSVCMAARQYADDPGNEYLLISQKGVTGALRLLAGADPELAHFRLRDAVGFEGNPRARAVRAHFESGDARPVPVLDMDVAGGRAVILDEAADPGTVRARMTRAGAPLAVTRHAAGEPVIRLGCDLYPAVPAVETGETGVDTEAAPGVDTEAAPGADTEAAPGADPGAEAARGPGEGPRVRAALPGTVRAADPGHDGRRAEVMIEHRTGSGVPFWTWYGHLAPGTGPALVPGDRVEAGQVIGSVGGARLPHVRLQLLTHVGEGPVPESASVDEADLWTSVSLDPNLLLGRREGVAARPPRGAASLAHRRRTNFSRAMSLSYREPLHIVRGEGAHLFDAEGRAWLDMVNNVCHVGHAHPRVVEAAHRQAVRLNTNTRYLHASVVEYARRLTALFPDPLRVCFFVNSGSEANDLAMRLATAHTGGADFLVLDHAYHGHLISQIGLSPYKFDGRGGRGRPETTWVCDLPDPYRGRLRADRDGGDLGPRYAESVAGQLDALDRRGRRPAAFFAESLQSCGGQIRYPDGYLEAAFARVREAGGLCVADEIQVGLGRVGSHVWGFELQGVVPDIVTLGKPIGNGHPLAAVITTPEVARSFTTGMEWFNTFGGNPVSAEAGLAVLDVMRDERLQANARLRGDQLMRGLRALQRDHPLVGDVRGAGLFIGVELSLAGRAPAVAEARAVKEAVKARGVLLSTDGPDDNVLKIKPPLVLGEADCDHFLNVLDDALHEVAAPERATAR